MIQRLDRNIPPSQCDLQLLDRLSDDTLDDLQSATLATHLDDCSHCRQRLEAIERRDADWAETREVILQDLRRDRYIPTALLVPKASDPGCEPTSSTSTSSLVRWLEPIPESVEQTGRWIGSLDGYPIRRVLGLGGMGVVFDAWDPRLHRTIAIKAMHPHLAANGTARQRFVREARAAAAVVHSNVVAIHGVSADHDPPYLVMPLVAGETLQARIDQHGPLEIDSALRIASQIADGLAAAHAQGLIHRDIKPGNILLEHGTERAMLTDFGVVRALNDATMTASGVIAGTPEFMSPEQANGDTLDARSDLFSLGSVLYAMLVGNPPFRADSALAVLRRIERDTPRPLQEHRPEIPDSVQALVDGLLAKSPESRIESTDKLAELVKALLAHRLDPKRQPIPPSLVPRGQHHNQIKTWIAMFLWVLCGLMLGLSFYWLAAHSIFPWDATPSAPVQSVQQREPKHAPLSDPLDPELELLNRLLETMESQLGPGLQSP